MDPVNDPFWKMLLTGFAQKGLTMAFMWLGTWGVFQKDQQSQFVALGTAALLAIVSAAWTYLHNLNIKTNAKSAVQTAAITGKTAP